MKVLLKRRENPPLIAGPGAPTNVMALVGTSFPKDESGQHQKVDALLAMEQPPDIIADLSLVPSPSPLFIRVVESGFAASTLPIYLATRRSGARIEEDELLDIAVQQMERGVAMLTIHPTATREMVELACVQRRVPWTSRGGGLVIGELLSNVSPDNVYVRILPEIISAAVKNGTVLSLGATFRSANIFDSFDDVQQLEINAQIALARTLAEAGVGVIIESPGHARPRDIRLIGQKLRSSGFPVMPLGPIPTDTAIGWDHVAAAIGASLMGCEGAAHILAAVTREEHTGGVPSLASTLEAVRSAQVAAHVIDLHLLDLAEDDDKVASMRAASRTCVIGKTTSGCSRCGKTCPL